MSLTFTPIFETSACFPAFKSFEPASAQVHTPSDIVERRQPNYFYEENKQQASIEVELPGVNKKDITIDIEENTLVLSAKRFSNSREMKPDEEKPEEPKPLVAYKLKLRIPKKYDTDNITASMQGNGILKMVIPIIQNKPNRSIVIH